ncbi:hypothetical protein T069G_02822 [Trichoderma breve]|uniref:Uncharacterized protein n=1 Tax=Trichoderma breve TaxID=2034170 RepID=A0A9W9BL37_9HYPO|nr:hypothetical protein T069G_02822 [Trichoderma breve]KAJ4861868.1 hypothetical protein T069G_02822 [Trichoderma breve]
MQLQGTVILVAALVGSVFAAGNPHIRAHNQFPSFFPASEDFLPGIIQSNCAGQFANYTNQSLPDGEGHAWAGKLIDCVLPACTKGYQNEFTVSGLLIGLLPAGLSQFGPSMANLALLINRDLASYVLTVPTIGFPRWLMRAPWVVRAAISCVEYLVGMLATGNVVYQVYRLTYKAVSQATYTVSIKIPNVLETYILFFWMVVMAPIFGIAYSTLRAGYSIASSKATQRKSAVVKWILDEFTPSLVDAETPMEVKRDAGGGAEELEPMRLD